MALLKKYRRIRVIRIMALGGSLSFAGAPDDKIDQWVKGVCRFCGTGCGVMVGVKDKKVVMVKKDRTTITQASFASRVP